MPTLTDKYIWTEGTEKAGLTTGNNDGTLTLDATRATAGQSIHRVLVTAPGATGKVYVQFFDDAAATTPISGTLPLNAQPPEGFVINKTVSSGKLGYRITGVTGGSATAYLTVIYST